MIVGEEGTEAAAATAVVMDDSEEESESNSEEKPFRMFLNRPFITCIIAGETNVPVFVGLVRDVPETKSGEDDSE